MPHNSALQEWVVLIANRSGRSRDRTDCWRCHRRGRGDTLTVASVPHLALGSNAPGGSPNQPGTPEAAASDLDNHLWVRTLLVQNVIEEKIRNFMRCWVKNSKRLLEEPFLHQVLLGVLLHNGIEVLFFPEQVPALAIDVNNASPMSRHRQMFLHAGPAV